MASPRYTRNIRPEDLIPDAPVQYTRAQRAANWWHYHKWYVIAAAVAAAVILSILFQTVWAPRPDCQVAIVTAEMLPDEVMDRLQMEFEALAADENGDGRVLVRINPYQMNFSGNSSVMDAYANFAGETQLNVDLEEGYSLIFLTDAPEQFADWCQQMSSLAIVEPDGLTEALVQMPVAWADSTGAGMDLGTFYLLDGTEHDGQEAMQPLYLMRRAESDGAALPGHPLWQALTGLD